MLVIENENSCKKNVMQKVYIWGAGYYADFIYSVIDKVNCIVVGIVDSNPEMQGNRWKYGLHISSPDRLGQTDFDYLFISPRNYEEIEKQCMDLGISQEKVVIYWRDREATGLYQNRAERIIESERIVAIYKNRFLNAPYEWGMKEIFQIRPAAELLHRIYEEKRSLCRYGDGEFEIMLYRDRPWFQKMNVKLAKRMREIIASKREDIFIAVADNLGNLEKYKEKAADDIREYIVPNRQEIISLLDSGCVYFDAYVSRPYIIYKDKEHAKEIFRLFKRIWKNREVLIVEGRTARIGVGNDLFQKAKKISRIECPEKNSWDKYNDILQMVKENAAPDTLICISLGPTATVLAYDLAVAGYQALDIGQLDNEYEWYIRGAKQRISIPGKMVAEVDKDSCADEMADIGANRKAEYIKQIVAKIDV